MNFSVKNIFKDTIFEHFRFVNTVGISLGLSLGYVAMSEHTQNVKFLTMQKSGYVRSYFVPTFLGLTFFKTLGYWITDWDDKHE